MDSLCLDLLCVIGVFLPAGWAGVPTGAGALEVWFLHLRYLVGDAVCLLLVFAACLVDCQFGLKGSGKRRVQGDAAETVREKRGRGRRELCG